MTAPATSRIAAAGIASLADTPSARPAPDRRGTDIFKALALGADAIAIGRPYLWGLGAFGQEGVETVLDLLKRELEIVMRQARTTRIDEITRDVIA